MAGKCASKDYSCYLKGSYYQDLSAEAKGPLVDVIKNLPEGVQSFFVSTEEGSSTEWPTEDGTSDYKIGNTWVRVGDEDLTGFRKLESKPLLSAFQAVVDKRSKSVELDEKPGNADKVVELENGKLYITHRAKEWWNESGNFPDDLQLLDDHGLQWIRLEADEQNAYRDLVEQEVNSPEGVVGDVAVNEVGESDEARSMIEEKIEGMTEEVTTPDDFFEAYDIDVKSYMQLANGDIYRTTYEEGYDGYGYNTLNSGLVLGSVSVSVEDVMKFLAAAVFCIIAIILLLKRVVFGGGSRTTTYYFPR
tara:strand:- start:448 stop:1362 length:915 start_codon:yes stop_codon:yes gene_type:complete